MVRHACFILPKIHIDNFNKIKKKIKPVPAAESLATRHPPDPCCAGPGSRFGEPHLVPVFVFLFFSLLWRGSPKLTSLSPKVTQHPAGETLCRVSVRPGGLGRVQLNRMLWVAGSLQGHCRASLGFFRHEDVPRGDCAHRQPQSPLEKRTVTDQ